MSGVQSELSRPPGLELGDFKDALTPFQPQVSQIPRRGSR